MSSYFVTNSFICLRTSFLYLIVGILQLINVNFNVSKFTYSNPNTFNGVFRFTNACIIQQYLTNYIFQVSGAVHFYQVFQTSVFVYCIRGFLGMYEWIWLVASVERDWHNHLHCHQCHSHHYGFSTLSCVLKVNSKYNPFLFWYIHSMLQEFIY